MDDCYENSPGSPHIVLPVKTGIHGGVTAGDRTYFERVCSRRCAQPPLPHHGYRIGVRHDDNILRLTAERTSPRTPMRGRYPWGRGRGRVRLTCTTPNRQATPHFHPLVRPSQGHSDSDAASTAGLVMLTIIAEIINAAAPGKKNIPMKSISNPPTNQIGTEQ